MQQPAPSRRDCQRLGKLRLRLKLSVRKIWSAAASEARRRFSSLCLRISGPGHHPKRRRASLAAALHSVPPWPTVLIGPGKSSHQSDIGIREHPWIFFIYLKRFSCHDSTRIEQGRVEIHRKESLSLALYARAHVGATGSRSSSVWLRR